MEEADGKLDAYPSPFVYAISDHNGTKPSGPDGTYVAAFAYTGNLEDRADSTTIIGAFRNNIRPGADVKAYLTHDWAADPFAKGTWCLLGPGSGDGFQRELQKPHGRVFFASADSADGWRGFVDGAIEQGLRITREVLSLLYA